MSAVSAGRERVFRIAVRKYGPFEEAIQAQWEAFERSAQTGLNLDAVPLELRALEEALFASGGMVEGDWDAAFVATDWIAAMHKLGCAVDLKPLLERDAPEDYPEGWSPSLLRLQQCDGRVLGIPYHDGPECLMYRHDLFEDLGVRSRYYSRFHQQLAPPATWAEFHRIARFLHNPAQGLYGTAFAALPDGHNSVYDFLLQLWSRGGDLWTDSGRLLFDTPEAEAALTFYRTILNDSAAVHPDCLRMDSVAAGMRFAAGEVAMMVNWFGFATYAHAAPESGVRGLVDVACVPAGDHGTAVSLNVYWILALAAGSPHTDVGWKFLRHTMRPAMDRLTTTSGAIGCRRSTWDDPQVREAIPFYGQLESLHRHAREIPRRDDWPVMAAVIDRLVVRTITTTTPIRELLEEADASVALAEGRRHSMRVPFTAKQSGARRRVVRSC